MLGMGVENPNGVPHRIVVVEAPPLGTLIYQKGRGITGLLRSEVPDLTDPATLGCLLALVREAHKDPNMTLHFHSFLGVDDGHDRGQGWTWLNHGHEIMPIGWHKSEAEALVAALEAA
jgi:hypothetical protein